MTRNLFDAITHGLVEAEGFFNLVYYQLCQAIEPNSPELPTLAGRIIDVVVKDPSNGRTQLKYRMYVPPEIATILSRILILYQSR